MKTQPPGIPMPALQKPAPAELHDGSDASPVSDVILRRSAMWIAILGFAAFVIALVMTLPASVIAGSLGISSMRPARGTAWVGGVMLPTGDRITWRTDVLGSLLSMSFNAKIKLIGPGTDLSGDLSASSSAVSLSRVSGVAGWSLLRAAWPDIGITCNVAARIPELTISRTGATIAATGRASTDAGSCTTETAQAFSAPATIISAASIGRTSQITAVLASDTSAALAAMDLSETGDIKVTVQPRALSLVPGANASGPVVYEMRAP